MTTQVISHNSNNQLFATRQQALDEISRNEYTIYKEATTMPCSFDERERIDFDLGYNDELSINVFVIDNPENILEPILIGYMYDVLTYKYNGKEVIMLHDDEMADSEFSSYLNDGCSINPYLATNELLAYITRNEIKECATYDDCYSIPESGAEIIHTQVKNIELDQHLIYEWVTKAYAEWDEFEREYLDKTDSYYHWTSQRTYFIERIRRINEAYEYDHDSDWRDEELEELRQEWEKEVKEAKPENNRYDIFCEEASFDDLVAEAY